MLQPGTKKVYKNIYILNTFTAFLKIQNTYYLEKCVKQRLYTLMRYKLCTARMFCLKIQEHLSIGCQTSENLEGLTESAFLASRLLRRIAVVLPRRGRGRPDLKRLPVGTLAVADLDLL